ncbi:substrate-binding domain-containing protein [Paraburkholderia domus]|uniref:Ribose import binding protein RbsB n=1 Tax=Paraburkholderia domus TaxID=2793075 RepID=A0A9N8MTU1_9BURK|nr:substrate-binding domain-containing protein [Paraburkholderia domus]MBK5164853.1 substrate-binding domain-containing protein [Burkholderia sp. R-70211]CAE6871991.1 Ribose import binding protein RbsB [Paraburkholderia domus]
MRRALALVVLFAVLTGAVPTASATRLGVVLAGSSLVFWQAMTRGIQQAAKDQHVEMVMRSPSDGASLGTQPNIQLRLIDYMMHSGVDGIVLVPEPLEEVTTPVSIAVPTVLVDRSSTDYNAISTVSTDNFAAGKKAALSLVPVLRKGAKVAVLRLAPSISSTTERENGFLSVAREEGWDVVVNTYVGYRPRDAEGLIAKALNAYAGHLDAVFAPAEPIAYGALRVIEAKAVGDRPRLVVFDWRPEFMDGLKRGVVYADVVQDPYRMGYLAIETLVAALRGHSPRPGVFVDVVTVTPNNINDPAIRAVLANYTQ